MAAKKSQLIYPALFSSITILIGISVLIGWGFEILIFKNWLSNETMMRANTAICMIFCGISILFLSLRPNSRPFLYGVGILNLLVITIAVLTLVQYLLQIDLGFDQLLFRDGTNLINPGRMSPTTAFCFLNLGIATVLFLSPIKQAYLSKPISAALGTTVFILSGLIFLGYIAYLLFNSRLINYANMSIHTSILFMLLSSSLLLLIKRAGNFSWALNASITGGCIVWLISLLLISFAYYNFINQIKNSNDEIIQTQKVLKEINNILIPLKNFNLNAKNEQQITDYFNRLDPLIDNHTKEQILLNKLNPIIQQIKNGKIALTDKTALKTQILAVLERLQKEEEYLFTMREAKLSKLSNQALLLSPLGIFLSISMLSMGLFILNANILERKKIRANQKQLAEIVEFSDDGIIGKDLNSIVTSWNAGAEQIFGYTAKEMIGQSIMAIIPPERVEEESQIINQIKQGKKIDHFETLRIRKDGKPIQISVTVSPIKNDENEIIGASKIVRDITEKKQLESQLRQSQKLSAIGELTGGIAHDFNNLLGIILGNMDLLERNLAENEEAMKRVKNTLNAATRGTDLTKRLLAFSRRQHLNPTPTILADSINNVVEMASRILGKNIQVVCQLDSAIPPAMIDTTELESALLNLAINARDAMPQGGKLVFSTKLLELDENYLAVQAGDIKPGTYAGISVTDTGDGISPEILEHVFEPFFTTKERGKGTGLGLSMVYGFIKQSGGVIRIYSEVGHGTTISLYLPLATNEKVQIEKPKTAIKLQKFSGKALVVDDEMDLLEIASVYLKEMGFDILHASNSNNALTLFENHPEIVLLVTDIIMPGGNGIDLAKKIKQLKQDIVVVYTSGFPAETLTGKSATFDEILISKPYNREVFVATINRAMHSSH